MAGIYNRNNPPGTTPLSQVDEMHRDNYTQIGDSFNLEHDFGALGSAQSGRHKFVIADDASLAGLSDLVDGSIGISTDHVPNGSTKLSLRVYKDSAWVNDTAAMYPDENVEVTKGHWGTYDTLSIVAGNINWSWDDNNAFKVTLTSDATLQFPTGTMLGPTKSDKFATRTLYLLQDGTGGWTLDFDNAGADKFCAGLGGVGILGVDESPNAVTVLNFQLLPNGWIIVTTMPDVQAIP